MFQRVSVGLLQAVEEIMERDGQQGLFKESCESLSG